MDDETGLTTERFDGAPVVTGLHHQVLVVFDLIDLHTEAQVGPGVLRVIGLVEDHGVGPAEIRDPGDGCDRPNGQWSHPAAPAARWHGRCEAFRE